ncbi:MAG: hypothetical protein WEB00_06695 [Dehalococcoidia bacterium]
MADKNTIKQAASRLQDNWSQLTSADISKAKGNVESLVKVIAEKTGETASSVNERVTRIIDEVHARRHKKTFMGRVRGFFAGLLKLGVALAAIGAAVAAGLMFWRKRMEQTEAQSYSPTPSEPPTMDQAAEVHMAETPEVPPTTAPD